MTAGPTDRPVSDDSRFEAVANASVDGLLVIDADGIVQFANPAAVAMFAAQTDALVGFHMGTPAVREPTELQLSGQGACRYVEMRASNFSWNGREATLASLRDITELRAMAARLSHVQKMESIGRLAGGVAHKLNNILMGIMNYADLSRDKLPPEHPVHPWQGAIVEDAKRAAALVGQLLAVGRRQFMTPERADLNTSIALLLGKLRRQFGPAVTLEWQPTDRPLPVLIDPAQLDQILAELCANASAAMDGRGTVTLATLALDREGAAAAGLPPEAPADEYAMLRVADTGRGMDAAMQARLFEPFVSTRDPAAGAGLGLAAVHGIVCQNSGFITAESTVGSGSVFRIMLPLQQVAEHDSID